MPIETVTADWIADMRFSLQDRNGYSIQMSKPDGVNGADLLPMSLIGCAAWDIVAILVKQRQQITGLRVVAQSLREEQPPWRFLKIHVHYLVSGVHIRPDSIQRAVHLTETKYCAIFATLRGAVEITSDYEIIAPV